MQSITYLSGEDVWTIARRFSPKRQTIIFKNLRNEIKIGTFVHKENVLVYWAILEDTRWELLKEIM